MFQSNRLIATSAVAALGLMLAWSAPADAQVTIRYGSSPYYGTQSHRYVQPGYSTYRQPSTYGQTYSYRQPYSYNAAPQRYSSGYRGNTSVYGAPVYGSYYGSPYGAVPGQQFYGNQSFYGNQPFYGSGMNRSQAQGAAVGGAIGGAVGGQRGAAIGSIIGAASQ